LFGSVCFEDYFSLFGCVCLFCQWFICLSLYLFVFVWLWLCLSACRFYVLPRFTISTVSGWLSVVVVFVYVLLFCLFAGWFVIVIAGLLLCSCVLVCCLFFIGLRVLCVLVMFERFVHVLCVWWASFIFDCIWFLLCVFAYMCVFLNYCTRFVFVVVFECVCVLLLLFCLSYVCCLLLLVCVCVHFGCLCPFVCACFKYVECCWLCWLFLFGFGGGCSLLND